MGRLSAFSRLKDSTPALATDAEPVGISPVPLSKGIEFRYDFTMNAIITVVGTDQVGIIAKVSNFLAQHSINIADISQTILSGNFVMMMMVELSAATIPMEELRGALDELGAQLKVTINIMHEKVFSAMHRI